MNEGKGLKVLIGVLLICVISLIMEVMEELKLLRVAM